MPRFRFSIASMMVATLGVALGFAALRTNSIAIGAVLMLATLALLCVSVFLGLAEKGPRRLPWLGIALLGWPCFLIGFGPLANDRMGTLYLTEVFEEAIPRLNPELDAEIRRFTPSGAKTYTAALPNNLGTILPAFRRYRQSSQAIVTLGFAAIGAALGRSLAAREGRDPGSP